MRCLLKNATIVDSCGERVTVHILTDDKKILKVSRENLDFPATLDGAKILDREDYGKIEENCIADLIAVKGNPYEMPYLLSKC
ncbi:hypothetical protein [Anaerocolumna sp. MB42-C2]|uniref:hypothetical protein n=1 Tax=Anaerocolumna sp. MB42-C2 TaxID=3070997 RepID=UPI0027DF987F|nr:hypothetical protein [Anaerocolumna sp. MB42-C2]WMJ88516.1 hypothetical protein RBU59_03090 [Anaerocolumna sp. MB42-C2]